MKRKNNLIKFILVIFFNMLIGTAIGLFRISGFGADPYSCLNIGISLVSGLSFSLVIFIANLIIFIFMLLFSRRLIGFGTLCNILLTGISADFTVSIAGEIHSVFIKTAFFAAAVLLMSLAIAFYMSADMGTAPYDAAAVMAEQFTDGRIHFRYARIISDAVCVSAGIICGAAAGMPWLAAGAGTIIMTFLTGPLIHFFYEKLARPLFSKL